MQILKGVELRSTAQFNTWLEINAGVMRGGEQCLNDDVVYATHSFKPLPTWRELDQYELKCLLEPSFENDRNNIIYIGKVPEEISRDILKLNLERCASYLEVLQAFKKNNDLVKSVQIKLWKFIAFHSKTGQFSFHRLAVSMPGNETSTFRTKGESYEFVGLHIDDSANFDLDEVDQAMNRISINISEECRHFMFVNLSLSQMASLLIGLRGIPKAHITKATIGKLFFTNFPSYPVVKVRIEPFYYYIAPTDNFFHDATTFERKGLDITLVYLGFFDKLSFNDALSYLP
jgi:hypothetical protein